MTQGTPFVQWAHPVLADTADALCCLPHSSGIESLEEVCLQVTDLLPGLRKLRNLLPEHGCLLLSPANFWQNDREHFHADPDIIGTIHQHEPKTLQTSATLKGTLREGFPKTLLDGCSGRPGVAARTQGWRWGGPLWPFSSCWFLPADLLFGVPGKYSGVSLYSRKRMAAYTITLVFQRYHAK